ncbi:MAG: molybdopterin molybdotransferase MoeA [Pseudomonadota bacterium]
MSQLISVDDAVDHILAHQPMQKIETLSIANALGRRLAKPVIARTTHPPAAMSAMDGYAVRLADVAAPQSRLTVIGEAPAGAPFAGSVSPGESVRVFTGSVIPDGADHIVIQEDAARDGNTVLIEAAHTQARHIRTEGLDFQTGDELIPAGEMLTPMHVSVIAASNNAQVDVQVPLRVGLLANGDELRQPGSALKFGDIINSNQFGLSGLIQAWGGQAINLGIASDSVDSIHERMAAEPDIDIFLPIGGASVGDHDHVRAAFLAARFDSLFEKIAVRPGKPTWLFKRDRQIVLGLPGNPASATVCAHLFLSPLLGTDWRQKLVTAQISDALPANGPREQYMRARAAISSAGTVEAAPIHNQDSSLLTPFLSSNALIRRPANAPPSEPGSATQLLFIAPII